MKLSLAAAFALTIGGFSTASHATVIGLPDPAFGTLWDTFSAVTFSNASGTGTNPLMIATLTAANGGGSIPSGVGNDRYYSGSGPATAAVSFTINGTASIALDSITVYLKYTNPSGMAGIWADYFTVTLDPNTHPDAVADELSTGQVELGGTGEFVGTGPNAQQMGVVRLTWTGLNINAGETFAVSITRPGSSTGPGHVSVDGIQIVPEPTAAALALCGVGLLTLRRRRKI